MAATPPDEIYRAMFEENGLPKLGVSATTLGIRHGKDIIPDHAGIVQQRAFNPGEANGLSCSPSILELPRFAVPKLWGGLNSYTAIWRLFAADLGSDLMACEDTATRASNRHISIGPSRPMVYDDFVKAIEATQSRWVRILKP